MELLFFKIDAIIRVTATVPCYYCSATVTAGAVAVICSYFLVGTVAVSVVTNLMLPLLLMLLVPLLLSLQLSATTTDVFSYIFQTPQKHYARNVFGSELCR